MPLDYRATISICWLTHFSRILRAVTRCDATRRRAVCSLISPACNFRDVQRPFFFSFFLSSRLLREYDDTCCFIFRCSHRFSRFLLCPVLPLYFGFLLFRVFNSSSIFTFEHSILVLYLRVDCIFRDFSPDGLFVFSLWICSVCFLVRLGLARL